MVSIARSTSARTGGVSGGSAAGCFDRLGGRLFGIAVFRSKIRIAERYANPPQG